ncbi:MAG TPA: ATP-binding protein, partial [Pyrinomonadaceae bacterium]|nr:ATP-binding protein [Pyrinomonadaceae bacterium]
LVAAYRLRLQQVRRKEKELRRVVETMPAFAWTALPDGSVDFVNRKWREYTGLSVEQTTGSGWHGVVYPEDLAPYLQEWRAAQDSGNPVQSELRLRAADGKYRWFLVRAVPLRDERGKIVKWYGTSTDIEERKRAEEERERLRKLESELAHINRVSTLGELTASLAHEIKQPITGAITSASAGIRWLTREQPNVEEARLLLEGIKRDGERTAEIVDRLKSFYKKEDRPQRERVDVNEVVGEMLLMMRSEAIQRSVVIQTELAVDLPFVWADRVQLQQVLMNLVLNAIEAMKDNAGDVTIRSRCKDGQVQVSVSDTGTGIPEGKMDQIFESFFTTKVAGTGMGLSISRTIIEAHGGRLWAENNDGRGATLHFTLPIEDSRIQS